MNPKHQYKYPPHLSKIQDMCELYTINFWNKEIKTLDDFRKLPMFKQFHKTPCMWMVIDRLYDGIRNEA